MDIEQRLMDMVSRFASSEEQVDREVGWVADWLDRCWDERQLPATTQLDVVYDRFRAIFGDGDIATMEKRANGALFLLAADLDELAGLVAEEAVGRDDPLIFSTQYRRAVLDRPNGVDIDALGPLAMEMLSQALSAVESSQILQGDGLQAEDVRELLTALERLPRPKGEVAALQIDAARVVGLFLKGDAEAAYDLASRCLRLGVMDRVSIAEQDRIAEPLRLLGACGARAALRLDRPDEAKRLADRVEGILRRIGVEIPGEIHAVMLDALLPVDPHAAYKLSTDLLRAKLATAVPEDSDVLQIAQRAVISATMTGRDDAIELAGYWRAIAASAPPSPGSQEMLETIEIVDEDDNPAGFEMPRLDVPDDLSDFNG